MSLRKIRFVAVAVILSALFLVAGVAQPTAHNSAARTAAPAPWTFSGCWTRFSAGPCRDIFVDDNGDHWICKDCGTTGKPGPGKCSPISSATLASGFWCS